MGFLDGLLNVATAVGQQMVRNYISKSQAEAAKRHNRLNTYSQYPAKILDNYYSNSRIENILKEKDVYGDEESPSTRQYYRDSYYFGGINWNQIFTFTTTGYLGKIVLVQEGNWDIYKNTIQLLASTCSLALISDEEEYAYVGEVDSEDEWNKYINELERKGLDSGSLTLAYADNWIFEYMMANNELPDNYEFFIHSLPVNGRLIVLNATNEDIILHFESANILKNSQF